MSPTVDGICTVSQNVPSGLTVSMWPSDAIRWQRSWSLLAQVMACCPSPPCHYLNQHWLITREVLRLSSEVNFTRYVPDTCHGFPFKNYWFKITDVFLRGKEFKVYVCHGAYQWKIKQPIKWQPHIWIGVLEWWYLTLKCRFGATKLDMEFACNCIYLLLDLYRTVNNMTAPRNTIAFDFTSILLGVRPHIESIVLNFWKYITVFNDLRRYCVHVAS